MDYSLDAVLSELPLPLPFCSVRIQYSGAPGSVIAQVSSVDERQDLVVDARAANEGDAWTGSGANPWHLDQQTQSFLFLTDESDKPARIGFVVTANGVRYDLMGLLLAAHETRLIDLRNLRDAQIPDPDGHRIPASASDGSINWIRLDNVPVAGRLVVIRRRGGVASNYDCTPCSCPDIFISLSVSPSSATILANATTNFGDTAVYEDCNGTLYRYPETPGSGWASGNTSVATVSDGTATGDGGGTATIYATYGDYERYSYDNVTDSCNCSLDGSDTASASVTVQKPTFVLYGSVTCPTHWCPAGYNNVPEKDITYQVLDQNGYAIQRAGMAVQESLFNFSGSCSGANPTPGTASTTGYGTFPDRIWICCQPSSNCTKSWNQDFTVDGYPVQVTTGLPNGLTGAKNLISGGCSNGQGSCPVDTPTP